MQIFTTMHKVLSTSLQVNETQLKLYMYAYIHEYLQCILHV